MRGAIAARCRHERTIGRVRNMIDPVPGLVQMMYARPAGNRPDRHVASPRPGGEPGTRRIEVHAMDLGPYDTLDHLPRLGIEYENLVTTVGREPETVEAERKGWCSSANVG